MEAFTSFVESLGSLLETLTSHSPFLAAVGVFALCGQIAKQIFTKEKALARGKLQWFWWRMRQTMPIHPVVAGLVVGLFDKANGMAYYALAGVVSVFLFDLIGRFTGYKIDLPGDSLPVEGPGK